MQTRELFYDKAKIIDIMRLVMARLRQQQVFVADVIAALAHRDVVLTRARFDSMYLTRQDRDVPIPLEHFQVLIAVLFDFDADILYADEFMSLAIAIRIPINHVHRYMRYFPTDDWYAALQSFGIHMRAAPVKSQLLGRAPILAHVYALMTTQQHVVLTGPAGIGKTAIAIELMRRYEVYHGQPLYYLDVRGVRTLAQLYEQLAQIFGVKSLANEPILLRLQMVLHTKIIYILIENLDGEDGSLPPSVVVNQIQAHLPMLRCVVTSRVTNVCAGMIGFHEVAVPPLATDHIRSSACQLFFQIYQQRGGRAIDSEYVLASCRAVNGNPLSISMIASAVVHSPLPAPANDAIRQNIDQLDTIDTQLVLLVSSLNIPLTVQFLYLIAPHVWGLGAHALQQRIDALAQRRVVYMVRSDDSTRVDVHAVVRHVIIHVTQSLHVRHLLRAVAHAILATHLRWEDITRDTVVAITTSDLQCILGCVTVLMTLHANDEAAAILNLGRALWVRHGISDEAILLVEQCVAVLSSSHGAMTELLFTLGSLHSARGMIPLALTYLQRAYAQAHAETHMELRCRIAAEIGMNGVIDTSTPAQISFETICAYFEEAVAFLVNHHDHALRASVYDLYAYVLFAAGDITQAIYYNDNAIAIYQTHAYVRGLIDAHFNRGLIFLAVGEFAQAQPALAMARAEYVRLHIPMGQAQCDLRLAAIAVLSGDLARTRASLTSAIDVLHRAGGMQDILFVMDIYSGVLMLQGEFNETISLCQRIEHFRAERRIFRGRQLDLVFQQQLQIAQQHARTLPPTHVRFALHLTFYDVIRLIRHDLLGE